MKHIGIQLNTSYAEHKSLNGKDYVVVPGVLLREMILEGVMGYPEGPEFIEEEELKRTANQWKDVPIVYGDLFDLGHPTSESERDSGEIGIVKDPTVRNKKLRASLWFDIEKLQSFENGGEVLKMIDNGDMLELSTGYFADKKSTPGSWQGRSYQNTQTDIRPDHLAVFTQGIGACSLDDGCGVNRLNFQGNVLKVHALSQARTPSYSGTTSGQWSRPTLSDFGFDSLDDMTADEKREVAETSLLGEADADTFADLLVLPVVDPQGNLNENALRNALARAGQVQGISEETVQSAQNVARRLLNEEFDADLEANVMKRMWNQFKSYVEKKFHQDSFEDRIEDVWDALIAEESAEAMDITVQEVFEDSVVYEIFSEDTGWVLYRRNYSIEDDEITLDSPEQVREVTTYEVVNKGGPMEPIKREDLIEVVTNAEIEGLSDDDLKDEKKFPDCALQALANSVKEEEEEEDPSEPEITAESVAKAFGVTEETVRAAFNTSKSQLEKDEEERKRLTKVITENMEISEDTLKETPLPVLRKMVPGHVDYSLQTGESGDDIPMPMNRKQFKEWRKKGVEDAE